MARAQALCHSERVTRQLDPDDPIRIFADAMPHIVWIADLDGKIEFSNLQWREYAGTMVDEHTSISSLLHPDDVALFKVAWSISRESQSPLVVDVRLRRESDSEYRWHKLRGVPILEGNSTAPRWYSTATDIEDIRHVEESLRESELQFRTMANSIPQLAWMARPNGYFFWFNQRWYDYSATTLEEMSGWGWMKVHHPDELDRVVSRITAHFASNEPWEDTFRLRRHDGEYRWHLSRMMPVRDASGEVQLWFGTNTDISEQRAMEAALRDADRRKDEFLATLAHELRNPLAPLRNGVEILRLAPGDREIGERILPMMDRQLSHMTRLIEDLMDVSRIANGRIELRLEVTDLCNLISQAASAAWSTMENFNTELVVSVPDAPIFVSLDHVRLTQVVGNLLQNAAKFTSHGTVRLRLSCEDTVALIEVSDDGIGMSADLIPHIFKLFTQGGASMERVHGGLGIGLSLAKEFSELHGGTISASSGGVGRGSTFTVRLPIAPRVAPTPPRPYIEPSIVRRRVLVADDNRGSATSLAMFLQLLGHETATANDGLEAIEMASSWHPHVILMDLGMPQMNGYESARRIRRMPGGEDIVIVALTGWGQPDDLTRSTEAGLDAHVVKPLDLAAAKRILGMQRGNVATL